MIVKNEEEVLGRCLESTKDIFDEIVIVDTGSTDKTVEIAEKFTDKVFHFKWIDDFAKARNFAFDKATNDYLMWLDADDVILENDLEKMRELKEKLDDTVNVYMFKYNIAFDESGNPTFSFNRERLIKNNENNRWHDQVHEYIPVSGKVECTDIAITHKKNKKEGNPDRNLNIYKKMKKQRKKFNARNTYYYARELSDHKEYKEASKEFNKFLDSKEGWIEDNINACILLSNCYSELKDDEKAFESLYKSFNYDKPRKKTCCFIGNKFLNKGDVKSALVWYQICLVTEENKSGFYESDYDKFIPYLNLCVCYDRIGDTKNSKKYHELSKELKPDHPSVIYNEKYFNSKK